MNLLDIWPTLGQHQPSGKRTNPQPCKRGPGREHGQGVERAKSTKRSGAGFGFVQHTNKRKNARRALKAEIGARQFRKQCKALALAAKEAA